MDLATGREIRRPQVKECVMTPLVIKCVEQLAANQGIKTLRFLDRKKKEIIFDDSDLAGVSDYRLDEIIDPNFLPDDEEEDEEFTYEEEITEDELEELLAEEEIDEDNGTRDSESTDESEKENDNVVNLNNEESNIDSDEEEVVHENDDDDNNDDDDENTGVTSSGRPMRVRTVPDRLDPNPSSKSYLQASPVKERVIRFEDLELKKRDQKDACYNIVTQSLKGDKKKEYSVESGRVIAELMKEIRDGVQIEGHSYAQRFYMKKGIEVYKEKAYDGYRKELDQMYRRNTFESVNVKELTKSEKRKAQNAIMLLKKKENKDSKGRMVFNGKPTREWLTREDTSSPTVSQEAIMIVAAIDAKEGRDVMTADVPNAFIQTPIDVESRDERIIMKIKGELVDLLCEIDVNTYGKHVVYEKGVKTLYVSVLLAIYGMLESSMLFYQKFRGDLESIGFKFNSYDPCVANRTIVGRQHTVRFHVDPKSQ